jgi:hypothetical protein
MLIRKPLVAVFVAEVGMQEYLFIETELSDLERQFIERRLEEDKSAMERLASSTFPLIFKIPYE